MAHVATITIDHTKVPGDLTDYVGLIVPDGSAGYAALYALCLEGGGDIRLFKSDDTTELAREIVTFSVSAETGEIHYKYSGTLSSSVDTAIHVYADGSSTEPSASATYGSEAVWGDYKFVSHDGGLEESTGNETTSNNGTSTDTTNVAIGADARLFNADGDATNNTLDPRSDIGTGIFSVQNWSKLTDSTKRANMFWLGASTSYHDFVSFFWGNNGGDSDTLRIQFRKGTSGGTTFTETGLKNSDYNSFTTTRTGNLAKVYVNASLEIDINNSIVSVNLGDTFRVGSPPFTPDSFRGYQDEIRLTTTVLAANYITTEYNNQNSPSTFYSVAAVAGSSAAQAARRGAVMMM